MKKSYLFGLCAASLLLTTSCQKDNLFGMWQDNKNEPVTVKMSVSLPEMSTATRANEDALKFGDGKTATKLYFGVFEVYDKNGDGTPERVYLPNVSGETTLSGLQANIALKLMPKSTYDIAFWASAEGATTLNSPATGIPYELTFKDATASIDVNYQAMNANDEDKDAFFNTIQGLTIDFDGGQVVQYKDGAPVQLYRPFAQLNIGTYQKDYDAATAAGFQVVKSEVIVSNVFEVLDLWTGKATANAERTYTKDNIPTNEYKFPLVEVSDENGGRIQYLAMNYLLMDQDSETQNKVTFKHYNAEGREKVREFSNVPARRNWRTNIYGDLLTSDISINVAIAPLFADENGKDDDENYNPDGNEWYDREQDKQ